MYIITTSDFSILCGFGVLGRSQRAKRHIDYIASDFSILRGLGVPSRPHRAPLFISVYWLPFQIG